MFKKTCLTFCILFLLSGLVFAGEFQIAKTSYMQTSDGVITAKSGYITGVRLLYGSAAGTLIIYDNASAASGNKIVSLKVSSTVVVADCLFPFPIQFFNGLYADVGGTGSEYTIEFISD